MVRFKGGVSCPRDTGIENRNESRKDDWIYLGEGRG